MHALHLHAITRACSTQSTHVFTCVSLTIEASVDVGVSANMIVVFFDCMRMLDRSWLQMSLFVAALNTPAILVDYFEIRRHLRSDLR